MLKWFALCAVAVLPLVGSPVLAQEATHVAICNPSKVFEKLDERAVIEKKIRDEATKSQAEAARRKKEIDDLKSAMSEVKEGSPLWQEKNEAMFQKVVDYEVWAKLKDAEIARMEKESVRSLFEKIRDGCKEVAEKRKLDLVLAERRPVLNDLTKYTAQQVRDLVGQNDVLFSTDKVDVTNDVIAAINAKFANGTGK